MYQKMYLVIYMFKVGIPSSERFRGYLQITSLNDNLKMNI